MHSHADFHQAIREVSYMLRTELTGNPKPQIRVFYTQTRSHQHARQEGQPCEWQVPESSVLFCICKSWKNENPLPHDKEEAPREPLWALLDHTPMTQRVLGPPSGSPYPTDTWEWTTALPSWKAGDPNGLRAWPGQGNPLESLTSATLLSQLWITSTLPEDNAHTTNSSEGLWGLGREEWGSSDQTN